uniref:AT21662p n=1 Tax=Drosophila melanogaster TaxID=7227 RepID=Q29QD4_DROME|nr:AT21662p [Drosophila melanogaster]
MSQYKWGILTDTASYNSCKIRTTGDDRSAAVDLGAVVQIGHKWSRFQHSFLAANYSRGHIGLIGYSAGRNQEVGGHLLLENQADAHADVNGSRCERNAHFARRYLGY